MSKEIRKFIEGFVGEESASEESTQGTSNNLTF